MRSKFDEQLAFLNTELIQMGALCEEAIFLAAKALEEGADPGRPTNSKNTGSVTYFFISH